MNITLNPPKPQQHERVFLDDLIQRYRLKLISTADYILSITKIYRPKGQKLVAPSAKTFCQQFGIAKSTFYRALKRLENLPELGFHWEPGSSISFWCGEVEDAVTPPAPEKKPTYTKLKDLPTAIRNKFENFVRHQWRKTKGEEIRSFHRFMENQKDFQNWWTQFQTAAATAAATTPAEAELKPESELNKRTFSPIPENLRGLFRKKPT